MAQDLLQQEIFLLFSAVLGFAAPAAAGFAV